MWFFRKKSDPRVKQITLQGQKKQDSKADGTHFRKYFFKIFTYFLLLWGVLYGGKILWIRIKGPLKIWWRNIYKQPLDHVEFKSNGFLTPQWVKPFLSDIRRDIDMMDIDIFAIKGKIETCFQVKKVIVQRKFPATLKIIIEERIPVLRLLISEGHLKREMLIDVEGVVFYGEGIPELERHAMPFLSGIILKKNKDGSYEKVPMFDKVYQLLHIAKTKYWSIYVQMEVVSIEHLKKRCVPWSKINVRCQCASAIIFKDSDFDEQLKRLDFILNTPKIRDNLPLERIDLSLGNDAVVKFQK
ncbi:MAG: FtsQ-type POTRA domain-containing protein [Puniceicoccales bacterium]|jgi:cell division septal protein FtsQ|nr:FtsQ-type POTRA domain-containing protein [Puniceicoccales bacterium]